MPPITQIIHFILKLKQNMVYLLKLSMVESRRLYITYIRKMDELLDLFTNNEENSGNDTKQMLKLLIEEITML